MENFIDDILDQLIKLAQEKKLESSSDFDKGKIFGYYEIISRMLNQAEAFGISEKLPTHIRNFNPDNLLDFEDRK